MSAKETDRYDSQYTVHNNKLRVHDLRRADGQCYGKEGEYINKQLGVCLFILYLQEGKYDAWLSLRTYKARKEYMRTIRFHTNPSERLIAARCREFLKDVRTW